MKRKHVKFTGICWDNDVSEKEQEEFRRCLVEGLLRAMKDLGAISDRQLQMAMMDLWKMSGEN